MRKFATLFERDGYITHREVILRSNQDGLAIGPASINVEAKLYVTKNGVVQGHPFQNESGEVTLFSQFDVVENIKRGLSSIRTNNPWVSPSWINDLKEVYGI